MLTMTLIAEKLPCETDIVIITSQVLQIENWRYDEVFSFFNPAVCPQQEHVFHGPVCVFLYNTNDLLNEIKQLLQSWNQTYFMDYHMYLFTKQTNKQQQLIEIVSIYIEMSWFSQNFLTDGPFESRPTSHCMKFTGKFSKYPSETCQYVTALLFQRST